MEKFYLTLGKIYRPPEGEGIHPREASRHHIENSSYCVKAMS